MQLNEQLSTIAPDWAQLLKDEVGKAYFLELENYITKQRATEIVFPPEHLVFEAFRKTPLNCVKVVLLGQDPYHGDCQAHGLCFSVPAGVPFPPSLRNIFKELKEDTGNAIPMTGDLSSWAKNGVLLLNATLTVKRNEAGSHAGKGWEQFTDKIIELLSEKKSGLVFILWGGYAKKKKHLIDESKHFIIESNHPSPLSANRGGFFGTRPFSTTNLLLKKAGIEPIDWSLE